MTGWFWVYFDQSWLPAWKDESGRFSAWCVSDPLTEKEVFVGPAIVEPPEPTFVIPARGIKEAKRDG